MKMNKKERMKEEVISDDDFVDTRNFVKMNRKEKMKPQIISDDEVSDEVTFIDKIISDDEFVDNDKGSKKTGATSSDKLCGELKKQKRFRSLSTVPTKNLESKLEKELSPKQKHTVKPQKSINSLKEITLTDPDTSSSFVPRKSERIAANASVLEKSSIYFSPGQTDPRVKAIAARTKSALLSCDAELKERASKGGMGIIMLCILKTSCLLHYILSVVHIIILLCYKMWGLYSPFELSCSMIKNL